MNAVMAPKYPAALIVALLCRKCPMLRRRNERDSEETGHDGSARHSTLGG